MVGIFDELGMGDMLRSITEEASRFKPQELNKMNIQAIFNRCLEKPDTKETTTAILFPTTTGYEFGVDLGTAFDKEIILKNKRNIEYLFGQLQIVHNGQVGDQHRHTENAFCHTYQGKAWTAERTPPLLHLLYLGATNETNLVSLFRKKDETTHLIWPIKPTLSPKDPAFPAWWEEHKSEWED